MTDLDTLLRFVELLQQYRAVERRVLVKNSDRSENDAEHSYSLAMLAWYINSSYKLDLDREQLFMAALAHDLVEVYAGDTYLYSTDKAHVDSKHEREAMAAKRLEDEFPEFPELHHAIKRYEKREDPESIFIYALDKIDPVLAIYTDGGRTWKKDNVSLDMLVTMKAPRVAVDKTISVIFEQLVTRLKAEHGDLFNHH
ncbi:MAG: metal dependent phosphohydrolase, putative hydrolase of superfamily [Parcubacteria group bacterium]|nr:metal dependent phosphohydrolase, putative hydrolase of superfamily [Parcubacteria group bacterium]